MPHTIRSARVFPDKDFPLRVMRAPSHAPTALHSHEFTELVMILAGRGRHVTDRVEYPIETGDVFVIRGDRVHGYRDTRQMDLINILFSPRRLGLPMADLGDIPGYHVLFRIEPRLREQSGFAARLRLNARQLGEAVGILSRLEEELASTAPGHRFLACAWLMHLIGYLSRCYHARGPERHPMLGIGRVLSYMEQHLADRVRVGDLARVAAMSESTLTRRFRDILGRPPADYLLNLRIRKAAEFLPQYDLRVTDVAFRCGFNDSNYFSRQFRRLMGQSPRAFRRKLQPAISPALQRRATALAPRSAV